MRVEYDKDLDIMQIKLKDRKCAFSEHINQNAIIDLDQDGRILPVEILDVSDFLGKELVEKTLRAEAAILT